MKIWPVSKSTKEREPWSVVGVTRDTITIRKNLEWQAWDRERAKRDRV